MFVVMSERVRVLADAAIRVIAASGLRGLTYRAVDVEAGLPAGSTSNRFRTRDDLIAGVIERMADLELADLDAAEGSATSAFDKWAAGGLSQTLTRFELMIEGVRSPRVAKALEEQRARFAALAESSAVAIPFGLTSPELVAVFAGLQFAEITTGEKVLEKALTWIATRDDATTQADRER
ncbi:Uncharacterised protein [Nocardia cyriacigeorgica]|uniref:HTH tetR-type domain-containing protein n=3 Tax=Nocardia cyriacigeorgica TaxID=135487 RepID=A0A4U8W9E6_9NOCA|nr:Uncharacterised protein [Nocardia cyriacigeorgica]